MSKINIAGLDEINDPFYRYKMTKLVISRQKKSWTLINNLDNVANDIGREQNLIIEFFKKKFSANFSIKKQMLVTSKDISYDEFEKAIREFIEYFVLCPICRLPETNIRKSSNDLYLDCICCSSTSLINPDIRGINKIIDCIKKVVQ